MNNEQAAKWTIKEHINVTIYPNKKQKSNKQNMYLAIDDFDFKKKPLKYQ